MLLEPPLEIDSIVPKKEVFSVPQFGQGPFKNLNNQCMQAVAVQYNLQHRVKKIHTFKITKSFIMALVSDRARYTMRGTAANQVKMKLKGSGSCTQQSKILTSVIVP